MADAQIKITADTSQAERALGGLSSSLKALAAVALGAGVARELAAMAIEATNLTNKLRTVSTSTEDANSKFYALAATAKLTGSNLGGTVDLFQKLAASETFAGSSTEALGAVVSNFNKTLQISGTEGAGAASALYQFSQAMQKGTLNGDEFRTIQETNGYLLKVLSKELGLTRVQLQQMAEEGRLSAEIVGKALYNNTQIAQDHKNMVSTIPQAYENLKTTVMTTVKAFDDFTGATSFVADAIKFLAENITGIAIAALVALAIAFAPVIAAAAPFIAMGAAISAAVVAAGVAIQQFIGFFGDMIKMIKSGTGVWDSLVATLDNGAKKIANFFGISYKLSKSTEEANKKIEVTQKAVNTQTQKGLVLNHQRNKQALDLDKSLNDQIMTMAVASGYDARMTDNSRIQLEIDKAIALEKIKYLKTGEQMLKNDIDRLSAAIRAREEAKLSAAGYQLIKDYQSDITKLSEDEAQKRLKINMAIKNGADKIEGQIALQRLMNEQIQKFYELEANDPGKNLFQRQSNAAAAFEKQIEKTNPRLANMVALLREGGEVNQGGLLVFGKDELGDMKIRYGEQVKLSDDRFKLIQQGQLTMATEAIRIDQEQRLKQLAIAEEYYASLLQLETDFMGKQKFSSETAKQIAAERANFEKKTDMEKYGFAIDQAAQMYSALGQQNRSAFEAAKAFNIANAIMNTYMAATKALAAYPPPFSFIAAAAAVGMGLAQVAQIRSQQYSGRALGGPVMGGNPYIVGENGPELFTPNTTGSITRNDQLGMGGVTNINFTIQANDAQGFDDLLVQRRGMITQMVSDAMVERGQRAL